MPRYEVRLESPDMMRDDGTHHFRRTVLVADDEDAARRRCERSELAQVLFELPPDELERLEAIDADPEQELQGADKGRLFQHRQEQPYQVVSVTELPPARGEGD